MYLTSCREDGAGECVGACRPDQHPGLSFEWADSNGDGCVSERELAEYRSNHDHESGPYYKSPFRSIDTTGDGCVSEDEWTVYLTECPPFKVHSPAWGCVWK